MSHFNLDDFQLVEPFDVDDGELNGLPPELIFVLGVEWEMIRHWLDSGQSFERPFHSENMERIKKMCERRGVNFTIHAHDDWPNLGVIR